MLGLARCGYSLDVSGGHGWAEQDPGGWWSAVVTAVRALRISETAEVVAIGVDGHGPTLVAVDPRGEATRPAITFLDTRSGSEADELAAATGVFGWGLGGLPAALWVERHEPAVAAATCWYLSTWEWLAFRLSGVAVAPLVPDQVVPDRRLVAEAGVPRRQVATDRPGRGRRRWPDRRGGGRARSPAGDAGRRRHGRCVRELRRRRAPGTGRCIRSRRLGGRLRRLLGSPVEVAGEFVTPGPLAGRYSVGAAMAATGRALDWYRESILGDTIAIDALLVEAAATPPGADGLVFLPYLAGERSPIWDRDARGVLAGLTLAHGRGHLARAIVEASALAIRHVAQPMLAAGVQVTDMRVCGGPARSPFWNTVKADVTRFRSPFRRSSRRPCSVRPSSARSGSASTPTSGGHAAMTPIAAPDRAARRQRRRLRPAVRRVRRDVPRDGARPAAAHRGRGMTDRHVRVTRRPQTHCPVRSTFMPSASGFRRATAAPPGPPRHRSGRTGRRHRRPDRPERLRQIDAPSP